MPLLACSDITYDIECEENKRFYYYYLFYSTMAFLFTEKNYYKNSIWTKLCSKAA